MTVYLARSPALASELTVVALSVVLLAIAIIIGLPNRRRPSILVELFIMALVGAHLLLILVAGGQGNHIWLYTLKFGFIPARSIGLYGFGWAPGGWAAYLWSPFTYVFLHADGSHLFSNALGLFVFGRTVAWRLGGWRFLSLFAGSAVAGAIMYMIFNWGSPSPLIGASAGVFGVMAATFRFVPGAEDRLKALFWPNEALRQLPLIGIGDLITERRGLVYGLLCLAIFPLGVLALLHGISGNVSVMAHVGGFAFGVLGFGYFDRHKPASLSTPPTVSGADTETEPWGLKVLRILAVLMMAIGIILSVLGYYLAAFF